MLAQKHKTFQNLSFKYKILLVILSGFMVLFLAGLFTLSLISRSYEKKLYHSIAASLSYSASEISDQMEAIDSIVDSVLSSQSIQSGLEKAKKAAQNSERQLYFNQVYNTLCDSMFVFNNEAIAYMTIVQDSQVISTSKTQYMEVPYYIRSSFIKKAKKAEGKTLILPDYGSQHGIFLVKQLRKIEGLSLEPLGVLLVNVDPEKLLASSSSSYQEFDQVSYLLFQEDQPIYHDSSLSEENARTLSENLEENYTVLKLQGERLFAVQREIPGCGWNYVCAVSYDSVYQTVALSSRLFLLFLLLSLLLVSFFSVRLVLAIFYHFDRLIDNMKRFGEGHYTVEAPKTYQGDEIGLLYQNFDAMVEKINGLIQENYVSEILKKEAQIKAMESQMDPHFLYNTLESINWRARMIQSEEISQMTTALGNLLRVSLGKNSQDFSLEQEMAVVRDYITIQKIRYQKRLEFQAQLPPELLKLHLPKFTLQPLIENAIRYGLEESSDTCYITIAGEKEGNDAVLTIVNTGSSFEENFMERLLSGQIKLHGFGIGILNIHKRLQMTFGNSYGLSFSNLEDPETLEDCAVVKIRLPYERKTEEEKE